MRGVCLDEECVVYELPEKIKEKNKSIEFTILDNKYKKSLENIYQTIKNDVSKDDIKLLYSNIPNTEVREEYIKGLIFSIISNNTIAEHNIKKNCIYLYTSRYSGSSLTHEVLHSLSSYYDEDRNIFYNGFSQTTNNYSLGEALNEGYTEYQNIEMFKVKGNETSYVYEIIIIKLLEKIIGKKYMKDMYFHADLYNLIRTLNNFTNITNIKNFIYRTDYILNYRKSIFKSEKATDTLLAINHFLIDTYSNYLLYLYNNGEINTCELDYLYLLFITELRQMLDIKLPINKDLLNRNISDNAWIHSERIRRKL